MKAIFCITSIDEARRLEDQVIAEYEDQTGYKKACEVLDEGFENAFRYAVVGPAHPRLRTYIPSKRCHMDFLLYIFN